MHKLATLILLTCTLPAGAATTRIANTQPADGVEVVLTPVKSDATAITAKLEKVTASEMFSRLAREAGVVIQAREEAVWDDPAIAGAVFTSEWDRSPLWEALREACESAEVRFETDRNEPGIPRIMLSRGKSPAQTFIDGPVLFRAEQITRTASINYADNSRGGEQVRLTLYVMLEPKLNRSRAAAGEVTVEKAEDERGLSLATTQPAERSTTPPTLPDSPRIPVPLDYPKDAGKKLALLRGSVPITVTKEFATITFSAPFDRFKNVKIPVGGNLLTLRSIDIKDDGQHHVEMTMSRGQKETNDAWSAASKAFGQSHANATFISANGPFLRPGSSSSWSDTEARTALYFSARQDKAPATSFRIEIPTAFDVITAKFEFKDINLP